MLTLLIGKIWSKVLPKIQDKLTPELIASILVWYRNWNTWNISLSLPKYFSNTNEKHVQSLKAIIFPSSISTYKLALLEPWQQFSPKSTIFQCQYQIPWRRDADTKHSHRWIDAQCSAADDNGLMMKMTVTSLRILNLRNPAMLHSFTCVWAFF